MRLGNEYFKEVIETQDIKVKTLLDENEIKYTHKWAICNECNGEGSELRSGLKGVDVTDMILDDPDFYDEYIGGKYDVACSSCKGSGKFKTYEVDIYTTNSEKITRFMEDWNDWQEYQEELNFEARCREQGREW